MSAVRSQWSLPQGIVARDEPIEESVRREEILAVQIAGAPYGLRAREVGGIATDRTIVPLPGAEHSLVGVTSIRGVVVPVFGLAELLDLNDAAPTRWLAWVAGERPVAFTFSQLEGLHRVPLDDIRDGADAWSVVRGTTRIHDQYRPIVDLSRAARAGFGRQAAALGGGRR